MKIGTEDQPSMLKRQLTLRCLLGLAIQLAVTTAAPGQTVVADQIALMSPEELTGLHVTSVSKKPEPLSGVPASVYLITSDAIRRSGATSLTDALRLAPNLNVASDNGIPGYISARGHNSGVYAGPNKLLVLIDGRSIYSPLFSGVFWDQQVVMLEDIDRIEVISGPAGVLWGVNAVNGVINIITKPADQTQGQLVSVNAGLRGARDISLRHGGQLGNGGSYRVYGKFFERGNSSAEQGGTVDDPWNKAMIGARADWGTEGDRVSWQANVFDGRAGQPLPGLFNLMATTSLPNIEYSGLNTTARWARSTADGGSLVMQGYLDLTRRSMRPALSDDNTIVDLEVQQNLPARGAHAVTWGANLRHSRNATSNGVDFGFLPETVSQSWISVFGQDEIALRRDLRLTLGARLERGPYHTTDFLPSVRLAWNVHPSHLLWTGVSRSARGPARLDAATAFPLTPPFLLRGTPDPKSETVNTLEIGYRAQGRRGSFSATVYRNIYDHLGSVTTPDGGTNWFTANTANSNATGIELWGEYQVLKTWKLSGGLTGHRERFGDRLGPPPPWVTGLGGDNPAHTAQIRSSWDVGGGKEFDLALRRVASLDNQNVASYNAIDARFGWTLSRNLELSITGQNLLGTEHVEYGNAQFRAIVPRQVFAKLVWKH